MALAHAKTGDPVMIAGYAGKSEALDEAIARFASAFADQTERDYETLSKVARQRKIPAAQRQWRRSTSPSSSRSR